MNRASAVASILPSLADSATARECRGRSDRAGQIVEGTLNSIEAEIEYAIERTARSPMIREAMIFRVGLFDRYAAELTGRSYSACRTRWCAIFRLMR